MIKIDTVYCLEGGESEGITYHRAQIIGSFLVQRRDGCHEGRKWSVVAVIGELVRAPFVQMIYSGDFLDRPLPADLRYGDNVETAIWLKEKVTPIREKCRWLPGLKEFAVNTVEFTAAEVVRVGEPEAQAVAQIVSEKTGFAIKQVVFDY